MLYITTEVRVIAGGNPDKMLFVKGGLDSRLRGNDDVQ